jgi:DNA-binding NtrC family response regulator
MQTVLTVDDDPNLLAGLARTLAREPFRLLQASSGDEALTLMMNEPVDVLLTDDRMPEMTGGVLAAHVHATYPEVVIMMLTGDTTIGSLTQAINHGHLFRLLLKPCATDDLKDALRAALTHKLVWDRCREAVPLLAQVNTLLGSVDARTGGAHGGAVDPLACSSLADLAKHLDRELGRLRQSLIGKDAALVPKTMPRTG